MKSLAEAQQALAKKKPTNQPTKILVDRLDVHGDVLVATSILPGLKEKYPDSTIAWHVRRGFGFALTNNPYIDIIVLGPLHGDYRKGYDIVVTPDHHYAWSKPMAQVHCEQAGVPLHKPELYFDPIELSAVPERHKNRIIIANHAGWRSRECPNLNQVLCDLSEHHSEMLQADNGKAICDSIDHYPELSLRQIAARMHFAKLYIGIDTVFMHMAVACGIPMVLCMGPTDQYTQYIPNATVIKPFKHRNPAMPNEMFAHGVPITLSTILLGIRTKLAEDGRIIDWRIDHPMISYATEEDYPCGQEKQKSG